MVSLRSNRRPNAPSMQVATVREDEALELRLRGHNYAQIGKLLGVSHEAARKAVMRAMERTRSSIAERAEEVREYEAARLDGILTRLADIAERTEDESTMLGVVDRLLRTQERRAKLLGLDLQRLEVTGANGGPIAIAAIQRVIVDAPPVETLTARVDAALPAQSETASALRVDADASSESVEITATCDDDNA